MKLHEIFFKKIRIEMFEIYTNEEKQGQSGRHEKSSCIQVYAILKK